MFLQVRSLTWLVLDPEKLSPQSVFEMLVGPRIVMYSYVHVRVERVAITCCEVNSRIDPILMLLASIIRTYRSHYLHRYMFTCHAHNVCVKFQRLPCILRHEHTYTIYISNACLSFFSCVIMYEYMHVGLYIQAVI